MPVLVLGDLAVIIIGLAALLFLYALSVIVKSISFVFPSVSVPFLGSLRSGIVSAINGALSPVRNYCLPIVINVISIIQSPQIFIASFISKLLGVAQEITATFQHVYSVAIPRALTAAYSRAAALYNQAIGYVNSQVVALRSAIAAAENAAIGVAQNLYNQAHAYAAGLYNQAIAFATAQSAAAISEAQHLYNLSIGFATNNGAAVLHEAQALYNQSVQHADALASQLDNEARTLANAAEQAGKSAAIAAETAAINAVTGPLITDLPNVWPALGKAVDGIIDAAAGGLTDAIDWAKGFDHAIPISAGATLAATLPIVTSLTKLAEDCVIPNCKNLSQFGKDLQNLFGIIEDAAFLGLLAEFFTNPAGAANEVKSILVPVMDATVGAAENLIGV